MLVDYINVNLLNTVDISAEFEWSAKGVVDVGCGLGVVVVVRSPEKHMVTVVPELLAKIVLLDATKQLGFLSLVEASNGFVEELEQWLQRCK
jgi:16S rRNA G527 N7-methylase RsmG